MGAYGWLKSHCTIYTTSDLRSVEVLLFTNWRPHLSSWTAVGGVTGNDRRDSPPLLVRPGQPTNWRQQRRIAARCFEGQRRWLIPREPVNLELNNRLWSCTGVMVKFHGPMALTGIILLRNREEQSHYGNDWRGRMALHSKSFSNFSFLVLFRAPG